MLNRLRAGRHAPSREVLGAILRAFGENAHVRELVLHFLEHELPLAHAGRLDLPRATTSTADVLTELPPKARAQVRAFLAHFLQRSLTTGEGLHLVAADPALLRTAVASIRTALDAHGITAIVLAGNASVERSLREEAVAAPLLIVERVEYASDEVRSLLAARAAVRKPVLLTSTSGDAEDAALRATRVSLDPASSPTLAHAAA